MVSDKCNSKEYRANKKLFFVIDSLNGGGAARVALSIAQGLKEKGFQINMHSLEESSQYRYVHNLSVSHLKGNIFYQILDLMRYIKKLKPKAIFSFLPRSNAIAILATLISGRRQKMRLVISDLLVPSDIYAFRFKNIRPIISMNLFYKYTDVLITMTKEAANQYSPGIAKKIVILPTPLKTSEIISKAKVAIKHPWVKSKIPFFVWIGWLIPRKDPLTLLRSFSLIRKHEKARLIIIGDGPDRSAAQTLASKLGIANDVAFLGFDQNPFPYLRNAAALIHTANSDLYPTVILEALALGTPVISTDCPTGPRAILDNGLYGALVPVGDASAISNCALRILKSEKYAYKMRIAALKRIKNFDFKRVIPQYVRLLTSQ